VECLFAGAYAETAVLCGAQSVVVEALGDMLCSTFPSGRSMTDESRLVGRLVIEVTANVVEVIFNLALALMPFAGKLGHLRIRPFADDGRFIYFGDIRSGGTVDSRIAKLDAAKASLNDALSAVDELKEQAEGNKRDLELLRYQIRRAETYKQSVSGELEALKEMATLDSEAVRRALRLPTRVSIWTERVIAFLFGVIASVVASYIYEFLVKPHL
jgi:hypothetical protein